MRRVILSAAIVGLFSAFVTPLFGADWPRFLGPNADNISPEKGVNKDWKAKPPQVLWRTAMHDGGFAGPSVADGAVYIIDHEDAEDVVRAISLKDGKDLWSVKYADNPKENYGYARSTPLVCDGKVYTFSRMAVAHCFDAKTGKVIWKRDLKADMGVRLPAWLAAGSPVADGDRILLSPGGAENAGLVALDKDSGKTLLAGGGSEKGGYATVVVADINGAKRYVIFPAEGVRGVDPANGKVLWGLTWKTQYDVNASTPIVIDGDKVFITSDYGRGCAFMQVKDDKVEKLWENKNMHSHFSTPVVHEGFIYGNSDPNRLVCIDPKDGSLKWEERGFEKGGVVGVEDVLIAMNGRSGELIMVKLSPDGYQELGRMQPFQGPQGQSWTAPIVAEGRIIARNKSELLCIDLK